MKKWFLYLFMGVGLLYTYALARIFSKHNQEISEDDLARRDFDKI